jgi:ATP-dependent protease ClpP protease subunit
MTLRESQVLEGREESVRDVARAFNIRPGHLGVETTGVYGNKADDTRDYVDNTLRPHMAGIAAQCRVKLLSLDRQGSHCFGHNTDELERLSLQEEFTAYGAGVTARIITPNEARGKLGFPPLPDGDTLQNPNTQAAPPPGKDPGTPPGTKPKKPKAKPSDELNSAHRELLDRTIAGVVAVIGEKGGRAAASGAKFCTWLDEKLPAERETLRRAIAPVASCIAAAAGGGRRRAYDNYRKPHAQKTSRRAQRDRHRKNRGRAQAGAHRVLSKLEQRTMSRFSKSGRLNKKPGFQMNLATDKSSAEIMLYGEIGFDFTARDFINQLATMGDVEQLDIRINSPGGIGSDGIAIYNALVRHPAQRTVYIDAAAYSAASIVAMAASPGQLKMAFNARMMIHNGWAFMMGDKNDLRKEADSLDFWTARSPRPTRSG